MPWQYTMQSERVIRIGNFTKRKVLFQQAPRVDIDGLFALWKEYLAFREEHKEEERQERKKFLKELAKTLDSAIK